MFRLYTFHQECMWQSGFTSAKSAPSFHSSSHLHEDMKDVAFACMADFSPAGVGFKSFRWLEQVADPLFDGMS